MILGQKLISCVLESRLSEWLYRFFCRMGGFLWVILGKGSFKYCGIMKKVAESSYEGFWYFISDLRRVLVTFVIFLGFNEAFETDSLKLKNTLKLKLFHMEECFFSHNNSNTSTLPKTLPFSRILENKIT